MSALTNGCPNSLKYSKSVIRSSQNIRYWIYLLYTSTELFYSKGISFPRKPRRESCKMKVQNYLFY